MPKDKFSQFDPDPLNTTVQEILPTNTKKKVPNNFPSIPPSTYRLAIIGEAPGEDEEHYGKPFVGMSGKVLDQFLSKHSIIRSSCYVGNIVQYRPDKNDIKNFDPDGDEFREGLGQLQSDLDLFQPNLCLLLGATAFRQAKKGSIFDWRGSIFVGELDGPFKGRKCLAALHPAYCLRQYDGMPLLNLDIRRARKESTFPEFKPPIRELYATLPFDQTVQALQEILTQKKPVSCDIEGGIRDVSCIGFALSKERGFVVPFTRLDGSGFWLRDEEVALWKLVSQILASPVIPKIWQNGLYDRFVLQWAHNIVVRNNADDTMLKHWELYAEMEKSLGFQASIYTNESFYKFERKTEEQDVFYLYCAKDAAITYEINDILSSHLTQPQKDHYHFNLEVLNPLLYMELRGIKYNQEEASKRLRIIQTHVNLQQARLDEEAAKVSALPNPIDFTLPVESIISRIQQVCCHKKDQTKPKKDYIEDYWSVLEELKKGPPFSDELKGQINLLVGASMNTKSPMFKDFLYKHLALPVQYKKDPQTKELRPTTDYDALLKLSSNHTHPALKAALELSRLRTRAQMLAIRSYKGRMHCSYNLVGSETGRVTSSKSMLYVEGNMRVGCNMQTVPDEWTVFPVGHPIREGMRDLLVADDGCYLGKADLKGADGWTIGAYMAMLGDRTMLDDLLYGIKPAQVVAFILIKGQSAYQQVAHDRAALSQALKCVTKDAWQYFVSKIGIWGTFYTMGPRALAGNVFIQSEGEVKLNEKDAREFQQCILVRYKASLWQNWMLNFMGKQSYPPMLNATNGFLRRFFGRKSDVQGQALAHLPQTYTTYATLLAVHRLWTDPENRRIEDGKAKLIVEPMHQVHDEAVVQWRIEDTEFAKRKIRDWFDNPMIIANQKITIPYDGSYGKNWAMDQAGKVGNL